MARRLFAGILGVQGVATSKKLHVEVEEGKVSGQPSTFIHS